MIERAIAIIPARGGSKGIPGKNVARVGGIPLVGRAILAARDAASFEEIYVTTDSDEIAEVSERFGAAVIRRPNELATDDASSEVALLHALAEVKAQTGDIPEVLAFLQATSPFIQSCPLRNAVSRVKEGHRDVVFSAIETYSFLWREGDSETLGVNHDIRQRPRRQDRHPDYWETGAFYVLRSSGFIEAKHRFFGRIGFEKTSASLAVEIDSAEELELARSISASHVSVDRISARALVMDFDGVHTDDRVWVDSQGNESVAVSRRDGMGIGILRNKGIPMLILSKERVPIVLVRAQKLEVEAQCGVDDKLAALIRWSDRVGIKLEDVAYVGNDVNDLECMSAVGWPIAVPDSHPHVQREARVILVSPGGRGAIREIAELMVANEGK